MFIRIPWQKDISCIYNKGLRLIKFKVLNNYLDKWGSLFMTSKSSSIIDLCLRAVKNPDLREPVINQKYNNNIKSEGQ